MYDYSKEFNDVISRINNLAKERGFKNGLHMAEEAQLSHIISYSEFVDYKNAHNMRNSGSHGFARDLNVSIDTVNYMTRIYYKLKQSSLKGFYSNSNRAYDYNNNKYINNLLSPSKVSTPSPRLSGGMNDDLDHSARFFNNSLQVTFTDCTKVFRGYKVTMIFVSSIDQKVWVKGYAINKDIDELIYEDYVSFQRGVKQRIVFNIKGAFIKYMQLYLHDGGSESATVNYSLKNQCIE